MLVKFASICDSCSTRGPEYEAYPSCSECGLDLCFNCARELDDYVPDRGPCRKCEQELDSEWMIDRQQVD